MLNERESRMRFARGEKPETFWQEVIWFWPATGNVLHRGLIHLARAGVVWACGAMVALFLLLLAGCAKPPPMKWVTLDGRATRDDPVLHQQATVAITICRGEAAKVVTPVVFTGGGLGGSLSAMAVAAQADQDRGTVLKGCMAAHGYLLVPE